SRANRRTAGLAYGTFSGMTLSASKATGGLRGGWASLALAGAGADAGAAGLGAGAGAAVSALAAGAAAGALAGLPSASPPAVGSIMATMAPVLSSSPTFTRSSRTMPSKGAGTSIVALSDSRVTRP